MSNAISDLDLFSRAYIQTAIWSSSDEDDVPLDRNFDEGDLYELGRQKILQDCTAFYEANKEIISAAIATGEVKCGPDFNEWGRAGHDFWLTRNHHGAGFWDGDWPEPYANQLTDAAHAFPECNLYVRTTGDGDRGLDIE